MTATALSAPADTPAPIPDPLTAAARRRGRHRRRGTGSRRDRRSGLSHRCVRAAGRGRPAGRVRGRRSEPAAGRDRTGLRAGRGRRRRLRRPHLRRPPQRDRAPRRAGFACARGPRAPARGRGASGPGSGAGIPSPARAPRQRSSRPRADRFCAASRPSARAPAGCTGRWCSRDPERARWPARARRWVDLTDAERVEIDRSWYRSHGLRASVSHRVVFHDLPVLELFGAPGAISAQPWFGRDALRTAASWAGMADSAVAGRPAGAGRAPVRGAP